MRRLSALCLAAALTQGPAPAAAQARQCDSRDKVLGLLAEKYGETRQSIGLTTQGTVVETFASSETGTWTVTVTHPDGRMCLIASGDAFENLSEALPPRGAPV